LLILAIIGFGALCGWIASMLLGRGYRLDGRALVAGLLGSFVGGLIFSLSTSVRVDSSARSSAP
jgi:uncharacterized membrane protein YeaQ/YmgE (transglycosylase-associated protein family)